ncbi:MAG: AsmA family protein [Gammaproteobacteria bacterium]|nr:AsmA family protein [Gammaproteobacteria bacterium]
MQAQLGDVGMEVSIRGDSLNEILMGSSMRFAVRDGTWKVRVPNSEASFDIDKLHGDIQVKKGNNITMKLEGNIDETPVKLRIVGAPLVEYVTRQDNILLAIDAELARSRLSFSSNVKLPLSDRDITLALKADSERIDHLNELLRLNLPPVGPVSLESKLKLTKGKYDLSKLDIRVGESHLKGKVKLGMQPRPRLDVLLVSESIQLDDFDDISTNQAEAETLEGGKADSMVEKPDGASVDNGVAPQPESGRSLLSYEVLSAFDADIKIEAKDVRSGKDRLGSALVKMNLNKARLSMAPLRINVPGGGIQVDTDFTPSPTDVNFNIKAAIDEFDIGVIARKRKPGTDMGGKFKLDTELHSQAPNTASLMKHADGHVDFALVPENFSAGVIDLWAVNLLSAVMDKSTEKDKLKINCVVVRYGMQDGLMKEKAIYLDTSNMRITGKSEIDFNTRKLGIRLAPKAKRPEFFSMAVPIEVKGRFEDFDFSVGGLRMVGQLASFVTSPVHVPIRRILTKDEPADGVEACKAAWSQKRLDETAADDPGKG